MASMTDIIVASYIIGVIDLCEFVEIGKSRRIDYAIVVYG